MGRPKADEKSAPLKMQEAFWTLLERKPYAQITISDITRESGLNRSAFYYHYGNIPELADDAIAAIYKEPGVTAFIARVIRQDNVDSLRDNALLFIGKPEHAASIRRLSLIIGSHGSTGLTEQLKSYVTGIWLTILGLDPDGLNPGQRLVLEYAAGGMIGVLGKARTLLTAEAVEWLAHSGLPGIIAQLINSLKEDGGPTRNGTEAKRH
ncbi:TetR/AcrR family transcriptional regulator [Bifidobacterium leontopitheci]|uniref:AcrR family transcriptional regulator n=1 Tax=Bifidobacterium leontopitheci TaxID=2650774 RepID=A0A6I1GMR8_9BIFI|nr:TetR/AcrR family transcriptional regulator [Bifidobacterium leontopitheci]KAB7790709.1 AcrR family transcriptional regulator [Bifidobacterium leontopitheci]